MVPKYDDDDLLMLSGVQHMAFCTRQWALIHVEQQWMENVKTIEGRHLHERVDDPFIKDSYDRKTIWRSVNLISYVLGLTGRADMVEFMRVQDDGITLPNKTGQWLPYPVEYKRGKPKTNQCDEAQLCAQAICLEEMFCIQIDEGALFYGETRRRKTVLFTDELRNLVAKLSFEMHRLFKQDLTPAPLFKPHCKSCSLMDICLPQATQMGNKAGNYLKKNLL